MVMLRSRPPGVRIGVTLGTVQTITAAKTFDGAITLSAAGAALTLSSGTGAIVIGTNPASAGAARFANAAIVSFRNGGNTADVDALTVTSANVIRVGIGTFSVMLTGGGGSIGFFGTTPIAQRAATADADGTLADITTKFNVVLADLRAYGLKAT